MTRVWVILGILLRSSLRGLQTSSVTSAIAVVTIAIALFLVGAFGLVVDNMNGLLDRFGSDLRVTAYLEDGGDEKQQRDLAARIETVEGVAHANLITKAQALERFEEMAGGAALLEGLELNPLPASIEIELAPAHRTPEGLAVLRTALDGLPGIEEVAHGQEWIDGYARAVQLARLAGYGIGTALVLAALLIVGNTIRLGIYAREEELDILALVGASRTYVNVPFLLEGTLQGAIGGLLALGILFSLYHVLLPQVRFGLAFFIGSATPEFFAAGEMTRLVGAGAGLGLLGSATALLGWRRQA